MKIFSEKNKFFKAFLRKFYRYLLFKFARPAYDQIIADRVSKKYKEAAEKWHRAWSAQHDSTGKNYWYGYSIGFNDALNNRPHRIYSQIRNNNKNV